MKLFKDSQTRVAKSSGFCMPYIEKEKSKNLVGRVQEDYEEFSGLRVRNRIVGILELRRNMKGRTMLRIDKLAGFPRKQLEEDPGYYREAAQGSRKNAVSAFQCYYWLGLEFNGEWHALGVQQRGVKWIR